MKRTVKLEFFGNIEEADDFILSDRISKHSSSILPERPKKRLNQTTVRV